MGIRLVQMVARKGTSNQQFVRRIPLDLLKEMRGARLAVPVGGEVRHITIGPNANHVRLTLGTSDLAEAKARQGEVGSYVERVFAAHRDNSEITLTDKQCVALAGLVYRAWGAEEARIRTIVAEQADAGSGFTITVAGEEDFTGTEEGERFEAAQGDVSRLLQAAEDGRWEELEMRLGALLTRLLTEHAGIGRVDVRSRKVLMVEVLRAASQGFARAGRIAGRDFTPDAGGERFPGLKEAGLGGGEGSKSDATKVSLGDILEAWHKEAKARKLAASTYESYANAINQFRVFLRHDDARRVEPGDVVRFKDHLLERGLSIKTIGGSYLVGLKQVFGHAFGNLRLTKNPTEGVKVGKVLRGSVEREGRAFTPEEASAILKTASQTPVAKRTHNAMLAAAKRWVPWLAAYSGARVGEMVQLRKEDFRWDEGTGSYVITITPEAGTVKTKEPREVPLHAHLVDLGFPEFVTGSKDGHLFLHVVSGNVRGAWRNVKNKLGEMVRGAAGVTAKDVQPNHAWRYTFKTRASEAGIKDGVIDAICGHKAATIGGRYRKITLAERVAAMTDYPRYGEGLEGDG